MDTNKIEELIKFNAYLIAQEIDDCEWVQGESESEYTKKCAKILAYDHIIELIFGQRK